VNAGFEIILPFLRPIAPFLQDPEISEIMVNAGGRVFVEYHGVVEEVAGVQLAEKSLQVAIRNVARTLGDDVSEERPILDARLPDGSRVAAVIPPCSIGGTTLTIRKFQSRFFTADELVRSETITVGGVREIQGAIDRRDNILISGGTGTGKTTLMNACTAFLPAADRVVVIEDTSELQVDMRNVVRLEARRAQRDLPAVTIRDLLRATLRHRPDRVLLGEVRGGEAYDLLQALNTGHAGSLSTIHANSAAQALARFASCVMQSGVDLPYTAVRRMIAECVHLVVHIDRRAGKRTVTELVLVAGYDGDRDEYALRAHDLDVSQRAIGEAETVAGQV
jgi:pilus assembly protein CpaF